MLEHCKVHDQEEEMWYKSAKADQAACQEAYSNSERTVAGLVASHVNNLLLISTLLC